MSFCFKSFPSFRSIFCSLICFYIKRSFATKNIWFSWTNSYLAFIFSFSSSSIFWCIYTTSFNYRYPIIICILFLNKIKNKNLFFFKENLPNFRSFRSNRNNFFSLFMCIFTLIYCLSNTTIIITLKKRCRTCWACWTYTLLNYKI